MRDRVKTGIPGLDEMLSMLKRNIVPVSGALERVR